MGTSNRDRRAAKQRRRDQKRGRTGAPAPTADRGLSAEALRRVLTDTAADLAAGHGEALTELRHLLTEHLARRREYVLTACDEVVGGEVGPDTPAENPSATLAETSGVADAAGLDAALGRADELVAALSAHLTGGGTVTSWAETQQITSEMAAVATVGVLARRLVGRAS